MTRKAIGKTKRFEIFKRDGFSCQYCGAHPPKVVLEVDHIVAVANGGDNDDGNLITACFDCNRGKAARDLSAIPQSLADKASEIAEREAQLLGYNEVLQAQRDRVEEDVWRVIKLLLNTDSTSYEVFNSVKRFVERLGVYEVLDAAEIALGSSVSSHRLFRYFCGVCWNRIRESGQ